MANENVIQATFDGFYKTYTEPSWLIDHGMELSISGIDLPDEFECHFSNSRSVAAKRQIGENGVVAIPDEYFLSNAAQIFCWIYLHPTVDSGVTEYEIVIPLRPRPNVDPAEPTQEQQDIVDQAIAALNVAMAATSADAASASESATAASNSASAALTSEQNASASASAAAGSASAALASQNAAAQSATAAANSATAAAGSASSASGSAATATTKASEAASSASAASGSASSASSKASEAATSATNAGTSASAAAGSASTASTAATSATNAKTAAETAQTAAETAQGKAETAQGKAEDAAAAAQSAMSTKADKVANATVGHVAALNANGNLTDNGNKYKPDPKDETMALRVGVDSDGRLWASGDSGSERFGVSGVGGSSTTLTRIWDAVGLTATPGTDLVQCQSDFDAFAVFNRKKCVGSWTVENGKAVFTPQAYEGDADYAEDGTMGDYVAVEVPPTYWYHDESRGILGISSGPHPGWEPHPICLDADDEIREHTYLPVYALAKDANGHAVSLPGYDPIFGSYKALWDAARTYGDGSSLANAAIIEPSVVDHYEWLMMTVEFATTNMQTVMQGAVSMPYSTGHTITAAPGANKVVLTAAIGNLFVVGQTIHIGADHGATPSGVSAYNHITAIEKA